MMRGGAEFAIFFDGDPEFEGLSVPQVRAAASRALNKIARDTRVEMARMIRAEINVPASYVSPSSGRLSVTEKAYPAHLRTVITAQSRNTSLARYVTARPRLGRAGVAVGVKPGTSKTLDRAFMLPLPRGFGSNTDGPKNLGLAIRMRKGESLSKSIAAKHMGRGLYLLYGPAVAQVFENNAGSGVSRDITPEVQDKLQREFLRLLKLENDNG